MITKQIGRMLSSGVWSAGVLVAGAWIAGAGLGSAHAQTAAQPKYPVPGGGFGNGAAAAKLQVPSIPTPTPITPNGTVVEDVVVRVNDQIITRSEVERSEEQLVQEAQQSNASAGELAEHQRDLLRDMIDNELLLSKGKELGVTCDAEVLRQLDELRKQNHLDSMEALEKAATQQGVSFEDFKANMRNTCIRRQVVQDQVGRKLNMTKTQEQAFYEEHKKEFEQQESAKLSEILIPTPENPTDEQVAQAQAKADQVEEKLKGGLAFTEAAKTYSGGPSAQQGGALGEYKRGALAKVLEDATFSLPAGGVTAPIRTRQGFVILRTDSHTPAGVAPLADVEPQVQEAMYVTALQPALRTYLTKAREEAYIDIKPGFVDTGSSRKETKPVFTAYTAPAVKKKTEEKRRMESQKDAAAQAHLAELRQQAADKAAARAAKNGGVQNVSFVKTKKVKREKVRFGQAPRNALPSAGETTVTGADTPLEGQAPGVALAGNNPSVTVVSSGTGTDPDPDPLAPRPAVRQKTRYTARQADVALAKATDKSVKAREHQAARLVAATPQDTASEKVQAAPLGLNGDTAKTKKVKVKRKKGDAKERLQEKPKVVDTAAPVAPTANPALVGSDATGLLPGPAATAPASSVDKTTDKPASSAPKSGGSSIPSSTVPPGSFPTAQPAPTTPTTQPVNPANPGPQ